MSVSPEEVNDAIGSVFYFNAYDGVQGKWHGEAPVPTQEVDRLTCLTFCVIYLKNGFCVYGTSSCVDSADYNQQLGQDYAYEEAIGKVFGLLGFRQRDVKYRSETPVEITLEKVQ